MVQRAELYFTLGGVDCADGEHILLLNHTQGPEGRNVLGAVLASVGHGCANNLPPTASCAEGLPLVACPQASGSSTSSSPPSSGFSVRIIRAGEAD